MRVFSLETVAILMLVWCVSGIAATAIERGIGHRYGKVWDGFSATANILLVDRGAVKSRWAWAFILVARCSMALLALMLIIYIGRSFAT